MKSSAWKDRIIVASVILSTGCLVIAVKASLTVKKNKEKVEQERYIRMVAEEDLQNTYTKIKSLENSLTKAQNQVQSLQDVLEKEKNAGVNLKTELEKSTRYNQVLQEDLKDALITAPSKETQGQP